ncbi:hypothetical protein [uncultured Paludibaculum sp.]|uniref:hypothetical protein n=1 Tax=uncultured Paludibaculum sp. TaxID=1765020 RepID=UPI002AAB0529|nr:hypothetical protein [uncultured Paludibaculum sp.]
MDDNEPPDCEPSEPSDYGRDPSDYEPPDPSDYEPDPLDYEPPDPSDYEPDPLDYEPPDPSDYEPDPLDYEPPDPSDYEPDPADYQPDDYEPDMPDYDDGPDWSDELDFDLYQQQIHRDAIKQFTSDRMQSFYVANPDLALPAWEALQYAQKLLPVEPLAAVVFATTAMELAIKVVLIRPIVSGLVHTEGLAAFITDLTTQHTGMDRFQELLREILANFGGVDLKTYTRPNSKRTLWQEIGDVQKERNRVIHRGEKGKDSMAHLGVAVATTLLLKIFPLILSKLKLHTHAPLRVCSENHPHPPVDGA